MDIRLWLTYLSQIISLIILHTEAKQRGDIEIPELPYADAYQWDEPVTDPSLLPDVTEIIKNVTSEIEPLHDITDKTTDVMKTEKTTTSLRLKITQASARTTTAPTKSPKTVSTLTVSNYKTAVDTGKAPVVHQPEPPEVPNTPLVDTVRQSERDSGVDMTYYIVGGSIAGGMVVVGGVVVTLGVLASQGKLGHPGFSSVPTSPA